MNSSAQESFLQLRSTNHQVTRVNFEHLPRFYLDRIVRLTPALYIMVSIITAVCLHLGIPRAVIIPDALSAFFYMHNNLPVMDSDKRLMRPGMFLNTWSLAVEEQFYIFWSLVMPFIVKSSVRKRIVIIVSLTTLSFCSRYFSGYAFLGPHMYEIDYRHSWLANVWKMFLGWPPV
jgi:peptidoglycan/LPS O-acetylase OafA/YrhL